MVWGGRKGHESPSIVYAKTARAQPRGGAYPSGTEGDREACLEVVKISSEQFKVNEALGKVPPSCESRQC